MVERAGRVLLFRRPDDSPLLAGTWELPWFAPADGDEPEAMGPAALAATYGGRWRLGARGGRVAHGITFRALEVEVYRAEVTGGDGVAEAVGGEAGWFDAAARRRLPQSALVAKALQALAAAGPPAAGGTTPARTGRPSRTRGRRRG